MNKEEKNEYAKRYYLENRARKLEKQKQYYLDNRERKLEYGKQYRAENLEYQKQYYQENRESNREKKKQYYHDHRDGVREQQQQSRAENPFVIKADNANRRAKKLGVPGRLIHQELQVLYDSTDRICPACQRAYDFDNVKLSLDHIIPFANPYCINEISNIQFICLACNHSKNNKIILFHP